MMNTQERVTLLLWMRPVMAAHLTRVFASLHFPSTDHGIGHGARVHVGAVARRCANDVHRHLHQISGDRALNK